jgi:hypothetical protein
MNWFLRHLFVSLTAILKRLALGLRLPGSKRSYVGAGDAPQLKHLVSLHELSQ